MRFDYLAEASGDEGERLLPGGRAMLAVLLDQRRPQAVGILVKLF